MPKIVVRTPELNPNSSWYTRYSGEGTPDAASISTSSTATDQKAAVRGRRRRGHDTDASAAAVPLIPGTRVGSWRASRRGSGLAWPFPGSSSSCSPAAPGGRLELLTEQRAKPAVPFGGVYRLIDFPLSNCQHSAIADVWVSVQFHPTSLSDHLANGRPWDLDRTSGGLLTLPPFQGTERGGWVTARPTRCGGRPSSIREYDPDALVVVSSDAVYKLDYREVVEAHLGSGAEVTMVTTEVAADDASRYGIVQVGDGGTDHRLRLQARRAGDDHRDQRGLRLHARRDAGPARGPERRGGGGRARGPRQPPPARADPRRAGPRATRSRVTGATSARSRRTGRRTATSSPGSRRSTSTTRRGRCTPGAAGTAPRAS